MIFTKTNLNDAYIIEPKVLGDHRGWFFEAYSKRLFEEAGIFIDFVQDNHSYNAHKNTLRGLHFQANPKPQAKLVRCVKGAIMDFIVDVRPNSSTYKQWLSVELSGENKKQLLVPRGFLHGFVALEDDSEVIYKVDNYYAPECDGAVAWNDPEFNINWNIENPILSEKDLNAPLFKDSKVNF